jgi:signal peptidase
MGWVRRTGSRLLELLLALVVLSLLAGAVLGQPILLSFVETGSMAPTMEPGDGFIAVPAPVAGEVEEGDVITFEAQQLNGGGLTTHRVVGETERGYVTRGDANPFPDQDGSEPPVTDGQVVAVALQVGGEVVVIPELGTAVEAVGGTMETVQRTLATTFGSRAFLGSQGLALLVAGAGALVLLVGALTDDRGRQRRGGDRDRDRNRAGVYDGLKLAAALALIVALTASGTMLSLSGTEEYGMVSAEFESDSPTTVPVGERANLTYPALNGGQLPVVAFYEPASENVGVAPERIRLDRGEQRNVTVTLQAPPETGYYPQYVTEYRYFAVLPVGVIVWLYGAHPWLPIVATSGVLALPFLVVGVVVLRGTVRTRRRSGTGGLL